jgi:hypothetical protein
VPGIDFHLSVIQIKEADGKGCNIIRRKTGSKDREIRICPVGKDGQDIGFPRRGRFLKLLVCPVDAASTGGAHGLLNGRQVQIVVGAIIRVQDFDNLVLIG